MDFHQADNIGAFWDSQR